MEWLPFIDVVLKAVIVMAVIAVIPRHPRLCVIAACLLMIGCGSSTPICSGSLSVGPLGVGVELTCRESEVEAPINPEQTPEKSP
jgi:hypothetical protein